MKLGQIVVAVEIRRRTDFEGAQETVARRHSKSAARTPADERSFDRAA
jgi:hypothetical protein